MQPASKSNNYHYNKKLQSYANELRHNMTKAEACLWKYNEKRKHLVEIIPVSPVKTPMSPAGGGVCRLAGGKGVDIPRWRARPV